MQYKSVLFFVQNSGRDKLGRAIAPLVSTGGWSLGLGLCLNEVCCAQVLSFVALDHQLVHKHNISIGDIGSRSNAQLTLAVAVLYDLDSLPGFGDLINFASCEPAWYLKKTHCLELTPLLGSERLSYEFPRYFCRAWVTWLLGF